MLRKCLSVLPTVGLAALLSLVSSSPALAQAYLGANLRPFAVLGATPNVTCAGGSIITGDVGVSPAASITGFPGLCPNPIGTLHANDGPAIAGQADLLTAYGVLDAQSCSSTIGPDLAGLSPVPGIYCVNAAASNLTGTLTLNAAGDPNASWIFQMTSSLVTSPNSTVSMIGNACSVQWLVRSSATIDTNTTFVGNILALTNITLNSGSNLVGRALARTAAVNMTGTTISFLPCGLGAGAGGVPTLSQWAVIVLAALLCLSGFFAIRRRRTTD